LKLVENFILAGILLGCLLAGCMQVIHILLTNGSNDIENETQLIIRSSDGKLMFHEVCSLFQ
jgi:hypothetical protein